jgi:O-antigen/teichoic acid export membrane protein
MTPYSVCFWLSLPSRCLRNLRGWVPGAEHRSALAGVGQLGGVAILGFATSAVLARALKSDEYRSWIVLTQMVASLVIFELGLSQVLTRRVSASIAKAEYGNVRQNLTDGLGLALLCSTPLILAGIGFRSQLARLLGLSNAAGAVVPFVLVAVAGSLMGPIHGFLRGQGALVKSVVILLSWRLTAAVASVLVAVRVGRVDSIGWAAAAVGGIFVVGLVGAYRASLAPSRPRGAHLVELFFEGTPMSVAALSVLFISGADVIALQRFESSAVPGYANGAMLVALVTGVQAAAFAGVPRMSAELWARGDSASLRRSAVELTRLGVFAVVATGACCAALLPFVLRLWIGDVVTNSAIQAVQVLLVATVIRSLFVAWYYTALGTGEYIKFRNVPIVEATVNISMSILLGSIYGALGVALGTLVGGLCSAAMVFTFCTKRITTYSLTSKSLMLEAIGPGAIAAGPLVAASAIGAQTDQLVVRIVVLLLALPIVLKSTGKLLKGRALATARHSERVEGAN